MAAVGALDAFKFVLVRPVFDRVLNPASGSKDIQLFTVPGTHHVVYLQSFVPAHFTMPGHAVAFALVGSTVLKGIFDYTGTYLVNHAGFGMITDLRDDLYNAIIRRSSAFFSKHATGTILSAIINDIERVQYAMSTVLAEFLQQFFTFVFVAGVVVVLGRSLAWVLLLFVPVIIYSSRKIGSRVRSTTRQGQDKLAEIQNILHETITGNRIVKAFNSEKWEISRFRGAARRLFRANLRSVAATAISSPLMDIVGSIGISLLLLIGRGRIAHNEMEAGGFLAFIAAVLSLYNPVRKFALFNNNFQQALGASSEIFKFMDAEDDVREKPSAKRLPAFSKNVKFDHVGFTYGSESADAPVLQDIDLDVRHGEVVAIVGSSGSGKSTLVHLIPRFFDVTEGHLLIDGHDVRDRNARVFARTSGNRDARNRSVQRHGAQQHRLRPASRPQKEVEAAARAALAHDFIKTLPAGYDEVIGERGVRLSGGERQRIAIARAILKNAPILILDEATSALDSESEALVQSALHNLMTGRTVFVIAHRLSTVRRADRIVVIENGAIADIGTHEELMTKLGTYRRLYDLQFSDFEQKLEPAQADSLKVAA
jgi:ATP-binding cassette, subfamily B, bacterial MsbA